MALVLAGAYQQFQHAPLSPIVLMSHGFIERQHGRSTGIAALEYLDPVLPRHAGNSLADQPARLWPIAFEFHVGERLRVEPQKRDELRPEILLDGCNRKPVPVSALINIVVGRTGIEQVLPSLAIMNARCWFLDSRAGVSNISVLDMR